MVLSESAVATLITGSVGIVAVLISKFKCLVQCDGCCTIKSFKFVFLDNSLVDEHNVEFKKITANGNDLIYVSKNVVHTEDENMDEENLLEDEIEFPFKEMVAIKYR